MNQPLHKNLQTPIAHSPNHKGEQHSLKAHLSAVANLASCFLENLQLNGLGYHAGLWHDLGKYSPVWQQALQDAIEYERTTGKRLKRLGVPHSIHGAKLAFKYSPLISLCIYGHHSGLPNKSCFKGKIQEEIADLKSAQVEIQKDLQNCFSIDKILEPKYSNKLQIDLTARLLFSALIDADRLDTVAHALSHPYQAVNYPSMAQLQHQFTSRRLSIIENSLAATTVNQVREEIYNYCVQAGNQGRAVYKLCAPTGGGKTFDLMGFAINHAVKNNLRRVIYAAPFTTIIEQTAEIYRDMFGTEVILEHHGAVVETSNIDDDMNPARLAIQNWDSPIIVTTTVQLLESLFSNRPSKCRKVHNIAGAVIVIDEVQALPAALMTPIISMLQNLVDYAGCSILLCTATQPAYNFIKNTDCQPNDVIPEHIVESHFTQLKRVEYMPTVNAWKWADVLIDIQNRNLQQTLIVANTTKDAREGYINLKEYYGDKCFHLSTRMYPKHRLKILNIIKNLLTNNQQCYLISTQLIEAGVDLDFNDGYRVIAPLDSIVQSAGRINRNGNCASKLGRLGTMTVFKLIEGKYPPGDYSECARIAQQIIDKGNNLNDPNTFYQYFAKRFDTKNTDIKDIQHFREAMEFQKVSDSFKLIDSDTESVFVPEEPEAKQLLAELKNKGFITKADFRLLQHYMVNLPTYVLNERCNDWFETVPGLRVWTSDYNLEYGIE